MRRNRVGEVEHCCWPGCEADRYEDAAAPPLCGTHLARCAAYVSAAMKSLSEPYIEGRSTEPQPVGNDDRGTDVVYYVRMGDHVKIGTTRNLAQRLAQLYVDHDPTALLGSESGGRKLERQRHAEFADERAFANRELFNPSRRLLAHIESLDA